MMFLYLQSKWIATQNTLIQQYFRNYLILQKKQGNIQLGPLCKHLSQNLQNIKEQLSPIQLPSEQINLNIATFFYSRVSQPRFQNIQFKMYIIFNQEMKDVSLLLRKLYQNSAPYHQLYQLKKKLNEALAILLKQSTIELNIIINFYYDFTLSKITNSQIINLLHIYFTSKEQSYVYQKSKLLVWHLTLIFKALLKKSFIITQQKQIFQQSLQILYQRYINEPINQIMQTIILVHELNHKLSFSLKSQNQFQIIKEYIYSKVNQLNIRSVLTICKHKIVNQNHSFLPIYQAIVRNIFQNIQQNGNSNLEVKIINYSLSYLSKKQLNQPFIKSQYLQQYISFINLILKHSNQASKQMVISTLPILIQNKMFFDYDLDKILKMLIENPEIIWSAKLLYILTIKNVNLNEYLKKITIQKIDIQNINNLVYLSIAYKIQCQLNPQSLQIKQLSNYFIQKISLITDLDKIISISKNQLIKQFHNLFYQHYKHIIQKSQLKSIAQYYTCALKISQLEELLQKTDFQQLAFVTTVILKRFLYYLNRDLQTTKSYLIIIKKLLVQFNRFTFKSINGISKLLISQYFKYYIHPEFQNISSQFFTILLDLFRNIPRIDVSIQNIFLSLLLQTQSPRISNFQQSFYYYQIIYQCSKFIKNIKNKKYQYLIIGKCIQYNINYSLDEQLQFFNKAQFFKLETFSSQNIKNLKLFLEENNLEILFKILAKLRLFKDKLSQVTINKLLIQILKILQKKTQSLRVTGLKISIIQNLKPFKSKLVGKFFIEKYLQEQQQNFQNYYLVDHCYMINQSVIYQVPSQNLLKLISKKFLKSIQNFQKLTLQQCIKTILFNRNIGDQLIPQKFIQPNLNINDYLVYLISQQDNLPIEKKLQQCLFKLSKEKQGIFYQILQYLNFKYSSLLSLSKSITYNGQYTLIPSQKQLQFLVFII